MNKLDRIIELLELIEHNTRKPTKKSAPVKRFKPPVNEDGSPNAEAAAHYMEKGYTFGLDNWCAHYQGNGWMVGRNKMKNWKASMVTWQKNSFTREPVQAPQQRVEDPFNYGE